MNLKNMKGLMFTLRYHPSSKTEYTLLKHINTKSQILHTEHDNTYKKIGVLKHVEWQKTQQGFLNQFVQYQFLQFYVFRKYTSLIHLSYLLIYSHRHTVLCIRYENSYTKMGNNAAGNHFQERNASLCYSILMGIKLIKNPKVSTCCQILRNIPRYPITLPFLVCVWEIWGE